MRCISGLPSLPFQYDCDGLRLQLEGLDLPRGRQVRAQAEVDELAHRVALHRVARLLLDELALQRLALLREQLQGLGLGDQLLLDGPVLLDDVRHLLLDGGEVLGREGLRHQEVVEEAVVGGRTDAALRVGEQLGHRRGQQVGGASGGRSRSGNRPAWSRPRDRCCQGVRRRSRRHLVGVQHQAAHVIPRGRRGWN